MGILSVSTGSLADGTQVMTLILDFSATNNIQVNLGGPIQARPVPIRTVYCDLSQTDQSLQIISQAAGDTPSLLCAGRSSGFYPCSFAPPGVLTVKFTGAAQYNPVNIQLKSTLIPGPVWPSAGGFASAVWANPARSLTVDPFTDAGGATINWSHVTRNLTGLGTGALITGLVVLSIPAGAQTFIGPALANIGALMFLCLGLTAGPAGTATIGLTTDNGGFFGVITTVAASASGGGFYMASNLGGTLATSQEIEVRNNDAANAINIIASDVTLKP